MSSVPITVWLALIALVSFFVILTIWARGVTWPRTLSVVAFLLTIPVTAVAMGFALGHPVPLINGVTVPAGEVQVLGAKMIINVGIYVLIDQGEEPPIYVFRPWSEGVAKQLQDALAEAGPEGDTKMTIPPFEFSWDQSEEQYHALPQPKVMPDKLQPPDVPEVDTDSI